MQQPGSSTPIGTFSVPADGLSAVGADTAAMSEAALSSPLGRSWTARALKRAMDMVGSAVALVVLAPLLLVLAIALTFETGGDPDLRAATCRPVGFTLPDLQVPHDVLRRGLAVAKPPPG